MKDRYFKCDPAKFECNAECCRSSNTKPVLGVGDYLRISEYTQEPITKIWLEKGAVKLVSRGDDHANEFLIDFGMLHDPCAYISGDNKCKIYKARPLVCAGFPLSSFIRKPHALNCYSSLKCINNCKLSADQERYFDGLDKIMKSEAELDLKFFWTDGPKYFFLRSWQDFLEPAETALIIMSKEDPHLKNFRSQRAMQSIKVMQGIREKSENAVYLDAQEATSHMENILFILLGDAIAKQLEDVAKQAGKHYMQTSRQFFGLKKK